MVTPAGLPGRYGEIDSLYVVPEERERGISGALAAAAITWLRALVMDAHEQAVKFWTAAGYRGDPAMTRHIKMI